jgi:hypothetical protein
MTDKTYHRDSNDSPSSGPIRTGSVLYRALELIAAEIIRRPKSDASIVAPPTRASAAEDAITASNPD